MLPASGLVPAIGAVLVPVTAPPRVHTGPIATGKKAPATLYPAICLVTPVITVTTSVTQPRLVHTLKAVLKYLGLNAPSSYSLQCRALE